MKDSMNPVLQDILVCPECESLQKLHFSKEAILCSACSNEYRIIQGKPVFCSISSDKVSCESPKKPGTGSFWRRTTWEFVRSFSDNTSPGQIVLEVGAGRGYYKPLFPNNYVGSDIRLTNNVDFVCNLEKQSSLRPNSVDIILLANTLEHVFEYETLLHNLVRSLKPNGLLLIVVPFMSGLHYVPNDYFRHTHFTIAKLAEKFKLELARLEAVYHPYSTLNSAICNLERSIVHDGSMRNLLGRVITKFMRHVLVNKILHRLVKTCRPFGVDNDLDLFVSDQRNVGRCPLGFQGALRK